MTLFKSITLLSVTVLSMAAAPRAGAAPITFEHFCTSAAACDNDRDFAFTVSLDSSVVSPNGSYVTTSDAGAALLEWTASSSVGDGFTISGGLAEIGSAPSGVQFDFDSNGILAAIIDPGASLLIFINSGIGRFEFTEPNNVIFRRDLSPSIVTDDTDVFLNFVPEPTTLSLLALGGLLAVRRRHRSH